MENHPVEASELDRLRRMAAAADAFSVWAIEPVEKSPHVELAAWRVMQLADGSRHLVGTNLGEGSCGRVSSRILAFDAIRSTAITDSGRVYQLVGSSGRSGDSDYVWRWWLEKAGLSAWMDVTGTVLAEIRNVRREPS